MKLDPFQLRNVGGSTGPWLRVLTTPCRLHHV